MRVFVTGASGWIGSALVPGLIGSGHQVVGLARSEESAKALTSAGVEVVQASLDDLETLRNVAAGSDGVIHLAFKHDIAFSGDFAGAADADRRVVGVFGEALAGSDKPFVIASGVLGLAQGRVSTEEDGRVPEPEALALSAGPLTRRGTGQVVLGLAADGVRSSVVRLAPTCHGDGDEGFVATLIAVAREKGVSGYIGDGSNRWPAAHRLDAAHLFQLALEKAPAGSALHGVAEEGIPLRQIAEVIGQHLDVPVKSIDPDAAFEHFGFLAFAIALDSPSSNAITKDLVGWSPTRQGLIEDLAEGHYFGRT
jgi:nucleoside-diphosphate-sugar epimerase